MRFPALVTILAALVLGGCSSTSENPPPPETGALEVRVLPLGLNASWDPMVNEPAGTAIISISSSARGR